MDKTDKYICYCNQVTEQEIINSIIKGNDTMDKIRKDTGACINGNCKVNNPSGKCCSLDIMKLINRYKK